MFRNVLVLIFSVFVIFCDGKLFKIAWMVPGSSSSYPINSGTSGGAMAVAMSALSKNSNILSGHQIDMKMFETSCDSQSGMMSAMTAKNSYDPDVMIGPPCPQAMKSVAKYGEFWNIPVYSWYNPDREFDSYANLIRMHPPMKYLAEVLVHTLSDIGQTQISLLYEDVPPYSVLKDSVEAELQKNNINILYSGKYISTATDLELNDMLLTMKKYSTTIVFLMSSDDLRRCMLATVRTAMTTDNYKYIHLDPQIYKDTELKTVVLGDGYWRRGDKSDQAARRAYDQLTHIVLDPMNDDKDPPLSKPRSRFTDFSRLEKSHTASNYSSLGIPSNGELDVYSLYLYDAVSVWSVLVDQMLKQNVSYRDGKAMTTRAKAFKAEGSTGYISLDNNADRIAKVFLLGMGADGAFHSQKVIKFDKTGGHTVIVLKNGVNTAAGAGGVTLSAGGEQSHSSGTVSSKSTTSLAQHVNEFRDIQQKATNAVSAGNSLTAIMDRLASLEKAITKVLNHDHTRDHPPHERLKPHYHVHPHPHPHPHPVVPAATTISPNQEAPEPSGAAAEAEAGPQSISHQKAAKTSAAISDAGSPSNVDALTSQIINKLTGVIDQKLSALQPSRNQQKPKPSKTAKSTPNNASAKTGQPAAGQKSQQQAAARNSEQPSAGNSGEQQAGATNPDYSEIVARLKEEFPQEMHPFIDFHSLAAPPSPPRRRNGVTNFQQQAQGSGSPGTQTWMQPASPNWYDMWWK